MLLQKNGCLKKLESWLDVNERTVEPFDSEEVL